MARIRRAVLLIAVAAAALVAAEAATPMGAIQGKTACFFEAGDIPGTPFFEVPKGHFVITPNGQLHVTCHGELPAGASVPETMRIDLPCEAGPPFTEARGHIIVTKSGRVNAVCHASTG
jgi:hypothetical protein